MAHMIEMGIITRTTEKRKPFFRTFCKKDTQIIKIISMKTISIIFLQTFLFDISVLFSMVIGTFLYLKYDSIQSEMTVIEAIENNIGNT
jgi:hypothetical protein